MGLFGLWVRGYRVVDTFGTESDPFGLAFPYGPGGLDRYYLTHTGSPLLWHMAPPVCRGPCTPPLLFAFGVVANHTDARLPLVMALRWA